ncbi:MAG: WHG domain-containing protein [Myxococcales bacterium]|nr:WHG domain-containing protein [Myxococcales bacterium]
MFQPDAAVRRVYEALAEGRLARDELTARKLASFLGQSTMVVYHHFDSLDGLLIRVDGLGWSALLERLEQTVCDGGRGESLALAYLDFAFSRPHLYYVMTAHPFDRDALRAAGRLRRAEDLWRRFGALVARLGARSPEVDTRVLFAGLHGLVSLHVGGRAELARGGADGAREATLTAAKRLASAIFPAPEKHRTTSRRRAEG